MKNELQTLRLFSPFFPHIYRENGISNLHTRTVYRNSYIEMSLFFTDSAEKS